MKPSILVSWSGGKDAAFTLHELRRREDFDVVALVTTVTSGYERIAMHGIRRDLLQAQARAVGVPVIEAVIPPQCDNATYESAFADALAQARARWPGVVHIAFGDLFLEDVRAYREKNLAGSGIQPLFPLWGRPTAALAKEMIAAGLRAHLVSVDLKKLPCGFAGREFDETLLRDLPPACDRCGENGEFHTFVSAGPMLAAEIPVSVGEIVERDGAAYADLRLGEA